MTKMLKYIPGTGLIVRGLTSADVRVTAPWPQQYWPVFRQMVLSNGGDVNDWLKLWDLAVKKPNDWVS